MTISQPPKNRQSGVTLLEALIAILIFSISLLGLIGIQASAIGLTIDAKTRADAAYLANQIIAQMWVDRANIDSYAHNPSGSTCSPSGGASTNNKVTGGANTGSWIQQVSKTLPGAVSSKQQISVTTVTGTTTREVKIGLCWRRPQDTSDHSFVTVTRINM